MTKLPDDDVLIRLYRDGVKDEEIASMYGVTHQAVSFRFGRMGLKRKPYISTATAILEAAYPSSGDFKRSDYTQLNRGRQLFSFMRWRMGDPKLTPRQRKLAQEFLTYVQENDVVVSLDPTAKTPWVWLPREPQDGDLVLRWPPAREKPKGDHLKAITLPEVEGADDAPAATASNQ
ncbi:hypothetical protein [Streptomyces ardesiacus]|uniref:hypothetical protein n=1 Tax=Streptomyces ardesiacus TaxID=285564 RepID=UPI00382072E3